MSKSKIIIGVAVIVVILAAVYVFVSNRDVVLGSTPGSNPIENYIPAILYNGGYYSALPIQTTSDITGATITGTSIVGPVTSTATSTFADVTMTSAATTTLKILSSSSTQGGCIQANATSTNTNIRLVFGAQSTTTSVGTFAGQVFWAYGTCE